MLSFDYYPTIVIVPYIIAITIVITIIIYIIFKIIILIPINVIINVDNNVITLSCFLVISVNWSAVNGKYIYALDLLKI